MRNRGSAEGQNKKFGRLQSSSSAAPIICHHVRNWCLVRKYGDIMQFVQKIDVYFLNIN